LTGITTSRIRDSQCKQDLINKSGGLVSSTGAAEMIGVSRYKIGRMRASNKLIAVTCNNGFGYPAFQFYHGRVLEGLDVALETLGGIDSWKKIQYFTSPSDILGGRTPIEALLDSMANNAEEAAKK
jgi:hypothetical protein